MRSTSYNSQLPVELARRIDAVCNRFETAWRSGAPPHIPDFLDGWSGEERSALLRELLPLDLDYRRAAGLPCGVEHYLVPFPDIDPTWLAEVLVGSSSPSWTSATPVGKPVADASPAKRIGCVGDFDLGEQVGAGGMGVVYRARDKGADAHLLPDKVVAMLRRWALSRLRDDLTAYGKLVQQNNPAVKRAIQLRLAGWQRDLGLAGLREKDAVDRLPQADRDACRKIWDDVDALLRSAHEK